MSINLSSSKDQIKVANVLEQFRKLYLQEALASAVDALELRTLNEELERFADAADLRKLAARGIRGELLFAVPSILELKPNLLAYYRLVLGHSQKAFYKKLGRFKNMEAKGILTESRKAELPDFCHALNRCASELMTGLGIERVTAALLDDLSLLTLGPQLRGRNNTVIGQAANRLVFEFLQSILRDHRKEVSEKEIRFENAAGRTILVCFSSDPDISITEVAGDSERQILAIEIKGGTDISNIWNRLGEAEKSHLTAKRIGFTQFWTIYNVDHLDLKKAREKSPTTQRFFSMEKILVNGTEENQLFRQQFVQLIGLRM